MKKIIFFSILSLVFSCSKEDGIKVKYDEASKAFIKNKCELDVLYMLAAFNKRGDKLSNFYFGDGGHKDILKIIDNDELNLKQKNEKLSAFKTKIPKYSEQCTYLSKVMSGHCMEFYPDKKMSLEKKRCYSNVFKHFDVLLFLYSQIETRDKGQFDITQIDADTFFETNTIGTELDLFNLPQGILIGAYEAFYKEFAREEKLVGGHGANRKVYKKNWPLLIQKMNYLIDHTPLWLSKHRLTLQKMVEALNENKMKKAQKLFKDLPRLKRDRQLVDAWGIPFAYASVVTDRFDIGTKINIANLKDRTCVFTKDLVGVSCIYHKDPEKVKKDEIKKIYDVDMTRTSKIVYSVKLGLANLNREEAEDILKGLTEKYGAPTSFIPYFFHKGEKSQENKNKGTYRFMGVHAGTDSLISVDFDHINGTSGLRVTHIKNRKMAEDEFEAVFNSWIDVMEEKQIALEKEVLAPDKGRSAEGSVIKDAVLEGL